MKNWIKIDRDRINDLPRARMVILSNENGSFLLIGQFTKDGDEIYILTHEKRPVLTTFNNFSHYAIIEEPNVERKYNSIEEFFEKTEWELDESYQIDKLPFDTYFIYIIVKESNLTSLTAEFTGKDKKECEQKLLDWANNERR